MSDKKRVTPSGDEKRSYFRVDDVISVVANPVAAGSDLDEEFLKSVKSSKAYSLMDSGSSGSSGPSTGARRRPVRRFFARRGRG